MRHINPAQIKLNNFRKAMEEIKPGKGIAAIEMNMPSTPIHVGENIGVLVR